MIFILFHNFRKIPIYCVIYVRSMCYLYFSTISSSIPNNQTINCSALIIICISFPHSIIVVSYYSKLDFNFLFQPFLKFHICRNQMFVLLFFYDKTDLYASYHYSKLQNIITGGKLPLITTADSSVTQHAHC
jgi:hypothetical protein